MCSVCASRCPLALIGATPTIAIAHPPPQVLRIARSADQDSVALLTNRGIIFGKIKAKQWRLMCNEALHINTSEVPDLAYMPDGRLFVATSVGLQASADEGCTWQGVDPFATTSVPAMWQDPDQPAALVIGTYGPGMSAVRSTDDGGKTWHELMPADDNDFIQELLVAPSDRDRMYASGEKLDMQGNFSHYVAKSGDGGKTWERYDFALLAGEIDVTMLAVSPVDPDVLLAHAVFGDPMMGSDRVLVSGDGGKTFTSVAMAKSVFDGAFGADGKSAWVASLDALLRSDDAAKSFASVADTQRMTCIVPRASELDACGWYAKDHDGIGISDDGANDLHAAPGVHGRGRVGAVPGHVGDRIDLLAAVARLAVRDLPHRLRHRRCGWWTEAAARRRASGGGGDASAAEHGRRWRA